MKSFYPERFAFCLISIVFLFCYVHPSYPQTILIPVGATWKYLADGTNQDTLWYQIGFDDSNWQQGPAQFGFGDNDEATVISFGPDRRNKFITYYFRYAFDLTDPSRFASLNLKLLRDGGAVAYLNGTEIARSNMPEGTIDFKTPALKSVLGNEETLFYDYFAGGDLLVPGKNILAVEVHLESRFALDMSFDCELLALAGAAKVLRKGPYLIYTGDKTKMQVLWQLKKSADCTIEWGLNSSYSLGTAQTREYGNDRQHTCIIPDLRPGTKYYYRLIAEGDTVAASFYAALDSEASELKFMVYGDTRSDPVSHDNVTRAMVATFTGDEKFQSLVLFTGDFVDYGEDEIEWDTQFFDPQYENIQRILASMPLQGTKGNHERSTEIYQKYFPYPYLSGCYWSFDYGPAHFAIVDQYTRYASGSEQLTWLENDLMATTRPWKFICLHEPGWSAGTHDNNVDVQNLIQPLCEKYDVSAIFASHNHYYARAVVNNVYHITTGGGGSPLYPPESNFPFVVIQKDVYHFCKLEIDGDLLKFAAVMPNGQIIDEFTIDKSSTGIEDLNRNGSVRLRLYPAHPNPFNPETIISFSLPAGSDVDLSIYDILGHRLTTLVHENLAAGYHQFTWDGKDDARLSMPSGIYFYKIQTEKLNQIGKMILLR